MSAERQPLPVDALLPAVRESLRQAPNLVLEAPPGAGKTTRVPPALLDRAAAKSWCSSRGGWRRGWRHAALPANSASPWARRPATGCASMRPPAPAHASRS